MGLRKYVPEPIEVLGIVSLLPSKKDQENDEQTSASDSKCPAAHESFVISPDFGHRSLLSDDFIYTATIVASLCLFVNTFCRVGVSWRQKEDRRPG
jgi:hypothetical protein